MESDGGPERRWGLAAVVSGVIRGPRGRTGSSGV